MWIDFKEPSVWKFGFVFPFGCQPMRVKQSSPMPDPKPRAIILMGVAGSGKSTVGASPSFSTRGVSDPGNRSRTTSWSKGLHYKCYFVVVI